MTMGSITGVARASLRAWWPEVLAGGILVVIAFAGQKDDLFFAIFAVIYGAIFWAMGFRHRHLPLAVAIRDTHSRIRRMEGKLDAAAAPPGPARPMGALIPFRRR